MLDTITFKFTDGPDITVPAKGITVFVGPNSSGKSLALREIECIFLDQNPKKIISSFTINWPPPPDDLPRIAERLQAETPKETAACHLTLRRMNSDGAVKI